MGAEPRDDLGIAGLTGAVEIGRGGFGVVYRARQDAFGRDVAVKILSGPRLDDEAQRRFVRECLATGSVSTHPNIVTVLDAGTTEDGRPYLVMEFLPGGSLGDRLAEHGPLPWPDAVSMGVSLAGALETAHHLGVLHRDIKPENVLVNAFGDACLADFGIARVQGGTETRSGVISASLAHAPPEVLDGRSPTAASDVYALASTIHTLIRGTAPFAAASDESLHPLMLRIFSQPPPDLREEGVHDEVVSVLERALAKDPAGRFATASEFGQALREAQRAAGLTPTPLRVLEGDGEEAVAQDGPVGAGAPPDSVGETPPEASVEPPADGSSVDEPTGSEPPAGEPPVDEETRRRSREELVASGAFAPPDEGADRPSPEASSAPATPDETAAAAGGVREAAGAGETAADPALPVAEAAAPDEPHRRRPVVLVGVALLALVLVAAIMLATGRTPSVEVAGADDASAGEAGDEGTGAAPTDEPVAPTTPPTPEASASPTDEPSPTTESDASPRPSPSSSVALTAPPRPQPTQTATSQPSPQPSPTRPAANAAPTAHIGRDFGAGLEPLTVNFSAEFSTDADGSITNYAWVFGDGATGTGMRVTHTFTDPGEYTTRLTVTDDDGATDSIEVTTTVTENTPPVAHFAAQPKNGYAPLAVRLDASSSSDPNGDAITYEWDFGDGAGASTGPVINHTFTQPGTYTVTLWVFDARGDSAKHMGEVTVLNNAPTASFTASPMSGTAPLTVDFDASESSDPDGASLTYAWYFTDDETRPSGATVRHTFQSAGSWQVQLVVTDAHGGTDSMSRWIVVS